MLAFGTDGIRGVANSEITPEIAVALGRVAARHLPAGGPFIVGRDTRRSGPVLLAAFAAGVAAEGSDVLDCGVIPTPGLAWVAAQREAPAAMVSASHNPFPDNGIKLFGRGGSKLSLEDEAAIQDDLAKATVNSEWLRPQALTGDAVGTITPDASAVPSYVAKLISVAGDAGAFSGQVVVDCANGSASAVAPAVFSGLGIDVAILSASPDGLNINAACGSTHLDDLRQAVTGSGAQLGIAFDGDADRMLAVDHVGEIVDGDQLIAMFAADLHQRGELTGDGVVATVLSNLGLKLALTRAGISLVETPVGDRHVADAMDAGGYVLGGEQSGHLIFRRHSATGDGILTALQLLDLLVRCQMSLSELAAASMKKVPQLMVNVRGVDKARLAEATLVWAEVKAVEEELGSTGRVVLRQSGTEPAVRVMVEGPTIEGVEELVHRLAAVVERELG